MSLLKISVTVNGRARRAEVEPRTQLVELLREEFNLTGTHIGCEQGVCGACTVMVDGRPQRSCISYAGDCDGSSITTIEGFDDDPLMAELRDGFSRHHALQCGFCTPGMLITARDIIVRLGETPAARIREELSGNLCRCTGYVGIVEAIKDVSAGKTAAHCPAPIAVIETAAVARPAGTTRISRDAAVAVPAAAAGVAPAGSRKGWSAIEQRLTVAFAPEAVWDQLSDIRRAASCLPGAEIVSVEGDRIHGRMSVALGPIKVAFQGEGSVALDAGERRGHVSGGGRDTGSGSAAEGEVEWRVLPGQASDSVIEVKLSWRLSGRLAQFNRGRLLQDLAQRLASIFIVNLEASLKGAAPGNPAIKPLSLWSLLFEAVRARFVRKHGSDA